MIEDAKAIGWNTEKSYTLPDKSILFVMDWHAQVVAMLMVLQPDAAGVFFCEPPPAPAAKVQAALPVPEGSHAK